MKYQIPQDGECIDLLTDAEYDACRNETEALRKGRAKAWKLHRETGVTGQLRDLAQGALDDSVLFLGYTRSAQLSSMIAPVAADEGVQFRCSLERSLVDGSVIGVRVTLVAFTR
jgi:hypothetical protein